MNNTEKTSERKKRRGEKVFYRNKKYGILIYNRIFLTALAMFLQIFAYIFLFFRFYSRGGTLFLFATNALALCVVLFLLSQEEKPSSKLGWCIILLLFPLFGVLTYLLFGIGRPLKKMRKKITAEREKNERYLIFGAEEKEYPPVCKYIERYGKYPAYTDGDVEYYPTGRETFKAMLDSVNGAKKYILAEYYIIAKGKAWDALLSALQKKAESGVKIFLIFDDTGCVNTLPPRYEKYLSSLHENIRCMRFNPITPVLSVRINNRDHRKILVIDGETAFTGGINVADEYIGAKTRFGYWKDSGLKIVGSAVNSFVCMFFNVWNAFSSRKEKVEEYLTAPRFDFSAGIIQPYDDSPFDKESVGETVYLELINRAQKSCCIFTPYLILDDFLRTALKNAAKRGVSVKIVVPAIPDKKTAYALTKANFEPLKRAGVKIYKYSSGFIHAKSMLTDGKYAVVGTINLDYRSLNLQYENAVFFTTQKAVSALKKDCEETVSVSEEITDGDLNCTRLSKIGRAILRVFEPLF